MYARIHVFRAHRKSLASTKEILGTGVFVFYRYRFALFSPIMPRAGLRNSLVEPPRPLDGTGHCWRISRSSSFLARDVLAEQESQTSAKSPPSHCHGHGRRSRRVVRIGTDRECLCQSSPSRSSPQSTYVDQRLGRSFPNATDLR